MLKERLSHLFTKYNIAIQTIIEDILTLEQTFISIEKPRIKEEVDQIISRLADKELERVDKGDEQSRSLF